MEGKKEGRKEGCIDGQMAQWRGRKMPFTFKSPSKYGFTPAKRGHTIQEVKSERVWPYGAV